MRKWLGNLLLKLTGWKACGNFPPPQQCVMITAPHTTNWDFVYMIMIQMAKGFSVRWMGKKSLFRWPFGGFMRWMGGISIDRSKHNDVVSQMADAFKQHPNLILAVPAEGTRKYVDYWKSGFYFIAQKANVPICLSFLDYTKKEGGIGPCITPSDDITQGMDQIRAFYKDIKGKYPENFGRIRLSIEDHPTTPNSPPNNLDTAPPQPSNLLK
ncbi:MAG: lysophospholipid acyltransferase family protein [Myxococcota bacterium]